MDADQAVVGIDTSATKNCTTVLDASGRFLVERMFEIPSRVADGPPAAIEAMAEAMDRALSLAGTAPVPSWRWASTRPGPPARTA